MKGRKPTAAGLKKLAGTYRKDRDSGEHATSAPVQSIPAPPDTLKADGIEAWNAICQEMTTVRSLQKLDLWLLEIACHAFQCFREKARAGTEITSSERIALKGMFSEFGLSPVSRRRVVGDPGPKARNCFENNGRRNPFDVLDDTHSKN